MNKVTLVYHGDVFNKRKSRRELKKEADMEGWFIADKRNADHQYKIEIGIWQKDYRRRVLNYQAAALLDSLVASKIVPDSRQEVVPCLTIEYKGQDKDDPRAEIKITEVEWQY